MDTPRNDYNAGVIMDFFHRYAAQFNDALTNKEVDAKLAAASFADYFVEASPQGVIGGSNDASFPEKIEQGYENYRKTGLERMKILKQEITFFNAQHAMARIEWEATYVKDGSNIVIPFEVIYFMQLKDETCKIFAYITGDEEKVLKEHGIL